MKTVDVDHDIAVTIPIHEHVVIRECASQKNLLLRTVCMIQNKEIFLEIRLVLPVHVIVALIFLLIFVAVIYSFPLLPLQMVLKYILKETFGKFNKLQNYVR